MFERKDISKLKKDIILDVELLGTKLNLHTRWGVFSPRSIDDGTLLLMKYISADEGDVCLDLGCGYGPIGLALARQCHKGQVHMVDKDFIAVELANENAKRNGIVNAKAYLSDAFTHVPSDIKFCKSAKEKTVELLTNSIASGISRGGMKLVSGSNKHSD